MIDIQALFNEAINRERQDSVSVDGIEYKINTHYTPWLGFGDKYTDYKNGKNTDIRRFDFLYKTGRDGEGNWIGDVPPNRENGLKELVKFYKEPFNGYEGYRKMVECAGCEIFEPFIKRYEIDLTMDDIHFHLYSNIIISLIENGVIENNSLYLVDDL
jgi:hypothetical protein